MLRNTLLNFSLLWFNVEQVSFIRPCSGCGNLQLKAEQEAGVGKLLRILWKITKNSVSTQVMAEENTGKYCNKSAFPRLFSLRS